MASNLYVHSNLRTYTRGMSIHIVQYNTTNNLSADLISRVRGKPTHVENLQFQNRVQYQIRKKTRVDVTQKIPTINFVIMCIFKVNGTMALQR